MSPEHESTAGSAKTLVGLWYPWMRAVLCLCLHLFLPGAFKNALEQSPEGRKTLSARTDESISKEGRKQEKKVRNDAFWEEIYHFVIFVWYLAQSGFVPRAHGPRHYFICKNNWRRGNACTYIGLLFFVLHLLIFPKLSNVSSSNAATVVTPGSNYFRKLANVPLLNKLRWVVFVCFK